MAPMEAARTIVLLLQVFADTMTRPTFATSPILVSRWLFARRRTILGISDNVRHHAAFHRLLANLITIGADGQMMTSSGDETSISRRRLKIFGTGMHAIPNRSVARILSHIERNVGSCTAW